MASRERALDLVRKLVSLADSPDANEAAAARERADALRRKFKIAAREVEALPSDTTRVDAGPLGSLREWRRALARAVADSTGTRPLEQGGRVLFEGCSAASAARLHARIAADINRRAYATCAAWHVARGPLALAWVTIFSAEAARAVARRLERGDVALPRPRQVWQDVAAPGDHEAWARAQAAKATPVAREAEARAISLVSSLRPALGDERARDFAARLVERAAAAGRECGEAVDLSVAQRLGC